MVEVEGLFAGVCDTSYYEASVISVARFGEIELRAL